MPRRVIVHPGFHKTGTTTIQQTLAANADTLSGHMQVQLRADMNGLCAAARTYSISRSAFDLGLVRYEAAALAESWTHNTVLLSSEDLSGHMPGRHGLTDYSATIPLSAAMAEGWADADITWIYYTRAAAPWLASCHVQHLRAARMVLDGAEYAERYAASAELGAIVTQVRANLPTARVADFALEAHRNSLLAPLLACAGIPEALCNEIRQANAANTSPDPDTIAAMLAINRSNRSDRAARAAQNDLNRRAR